MFVSSVFCCCVAVRLFRCFVFVSFSYFGMFANAFVCDFVVVMLFVFGCLLFAVFFGCAVLLAV